MKHIFLILVCSPLLYFYGCNELQSVEKSPFSDIYWENEIPFVLIDSTWYELKEIEGIPMSDVTNHLKKVHSLDWKRRLGQDFNIIMAEQFKPVLFSTELVVIPLDGKEEIEIKAKLSTENRISLLRNSWKHQVIERKPNTKTKDNFEWITTRIDGYSPSEELLQRQESINEEIQAIASKRNISLAEARQIYSILYGTTKLWVDKDQALEDLRHLEWLIDHHFSYYMLSDLDYKNLIDALKLDIGEDGISKRDFARQLKIFFASFADGHTRISFDTISRDRNKLPFRLILYNDRILGTTLANTENESTLLDSDNPYVLSINEIPISQILEKADHYSSNGSDSFNKAVLESVLNNAMDIMLKEFRALKDNSITLELGDSEVNAERSFTFEKVTPNISLENKSKIPALDHKIISSSIGYLPIRESMDGSDEFQALLRNAMDSFKETEALIIDIRGNSGGSRAPLKTLLPYFIKEPVIGNISYYRVNDEDDPLNREGYMDLRYSYPITYSGWDTDETSVINEHLQKFNRQIELDSSKFSVPHYMLINPEFSESYYYDKPVFILMDKYNYSASDIFLGAFKQLDNVILVGQPSGGGSGFAQFRHLKNSGIGFQMSAIVSFQPNGELYDHNGISPDVLIEPDLQDLLGKSDTILEETIKKIVGN